MRIRLSAGRRPLLALAVVLSLAGCVSGGGRAVTAAGCAEYAQRVSPAGQVSWQVLLDAGPGSDFGPDVVPLAVGGVAVFAQNGVVHGLRLAGGQALWAYADGLSVYGMWRWQGLVVVLSGQSGGGASVMGETWGGRLTGLDAATGAVRWTLPMTGIGPQVDAVATADGGLAVAGMLGQLTVVDMADGTVRWSRAYTGPGLAAAAGLVLYGSGGWLTADDDRTGVPRWTAPSENMVLPQMQLAAGLLLVSSEFGGSPVTAYNLATGRVAWTFETPGSQAGATASWEAAAAGPAGVAVAVANLPAPGRLYLLDPATGRVRWQAAALAGAGPLVTAVGVADVEGTAGNGPVAIVGRDAADGRVGWRDTLPQPASDAGQGGADQLVQAGQLVLVQGSANAGQPATLSAYQLADGRRAWQVIEPEDVEEPPVLVPGQGFLVQPDMPSSGCGPVPM